tara:strand:- start:6237 stop:6806 length:570 start_codon:yes stop_codon:yes gene_type:complete
MKSFKVIGKLLFLFFLPGILLTIPKAQSAEEIKIIYSVFSRTIKLDSLKEFAQKGKPDKRLKKILGITNSSDDEILNILNKNFDIPVTIASKLMYSEIGNVVLTRLSKIIHPPNARDEKTGILALRSGVIKGINLGDGAINTITFFEGYPTKTVILNVNALSKIINKVESINELLEFFTNSPINKITNN